MGADGVRIKTMPRSSYGQQGCRPPLPAHSGHYCRCHATWSPGSLDSTFHSAAPQPRRPIGSVLSEDIIQQLELGQAADPGLAPRHAS